MTRIGVAAVVYITAQSSTKPAEQTATAKAPAAVTHSVAAKLEHPSDGALPPDYTFYDGAGKAMKIADFDIDPRPWLQHGRAKAVMALSPIAEAEERRRARDVVKALAGTILAEDLSKIRFFQIEAPDTVTVS